MGVTYPGERFETSKNDVIDAKPIIKVNIPAHPGTIGIVNIRNGAYRIRYAVIYTDTNA